jgi:biopolymer transport protein ExbD
MMAISVGRRRGAIADVNVTPMADIMIVLLIIFMVMTPLIDRGQVKDLPSAKHPEDKEISRIEVSLNAVGELYLGPTRLAGAGELLPRLRELLLSLPEASRIIHFSADATVPYDQIREIMAVCRDAGVDEVALMTRRRLRH